MSLLMLFSGASNPVDTHDGVGGYSKKQYDDLQKRLKRQREQVELRERTEQKRKIELRRELTRLYQGLPEETKETIRTVAPQQERAKKREEFGNILAGLSILQDTLKSAQFDMVQEYLAIEQRQKQIQDADDNEELQMILAAIL